METAYIEQTAGWAQVAPLIQARQREMAERLAGGVSGASLEPTEASMPGGAALSRGDGGARNAASPELSARSDVTRQGRTENTDASGLTEAEQRMVAELRARDAEVRRHEQAHAAVGGEYAGAPTYTYQTGPDGRQYAVGGAVAIDVAPVDGDPEATIEKMDVVKAAALAPAEPSAADRQVAALADAQRMQAIAELAAIRAAERTGALDRRV